MIKDFKLDLGLPNYFQYARLAIIQIVCNLIEMGTIIFNRFHILAFLGQSIFSISFVLSFLWGVEVEDVVPVLAVPVLAVLAGVWIFILFCKVVPISRASPVGLVALPVWAVHFGL